jgi:hypothetical protein
MTINNPFYHQLSQCDCDTRRDFTDKRQQLLSLPKLASLLTNQLDENCHQHRKIYAGGFSDRAKTANARNRQLAVQRGAGGWLKRPQAAKECRGSGRGLCSCTSSAVPFPIAGSSFSEILRACPILHADSRTATGHRSDRRRPTAVAVMLMSMQASSIWTWHSCWRARPSHGRSSTLL